MAVLQGAGADIALHLRGMADGATFMAQSALALGAAVATVLAVAVGGTRRALAAAIAFAVAAAVSAWLPQPLADGVLVPAVVLALGLTIAAGVRLRGALALAALVPGGVAAGIAGSLQTATWEETLGGLLVLFIPVLAGFLASVRIVVPVRVQRGVTTARRAAGAWIAAIGILVLALWLRRGG